MLEVHNFPKSSAAFIGLSYKITFSVIKIIPVTEKTNGKNTYQ